MLSPIVLFSLVAYALTPRALADKVSPDHRDSLAALAGVATGALAAYFLVVTAALFTLAILFGRLSLYPPTPEYGRRTTTD